MMKNRPRIRPRINEWMASHSFIREKFVDGLWARLALLLSVPDKAKVNCDYAIARRRFPVEARVPEA